MKKIGVILLTVFICACTTVKDKQNNNTIIPEYVLNAVKNMDFTVVVDQMAPQRYYSRTINSYHFIKVKDATLVSDLPYIGQVQIPTAYSSSITKGLNFTEQIRELAQKNNDRKQRTEIDILVKNEEDSYLYRIYIYFNGNAEIMVKPTKRDFIRFYGQLVD